MSTVQFIQQIFVDRNSNLKIRHKPGLEAKKVENHFLLKRTSNGVNGASCLPRPQCHAEPMKKNVLDKLFFYN